MSNEPYRSSQYIDFNTGSVIQDPQTFVHNSPPPWTVDRKLDFFACRVDVWQLGVAVEILKQIESPVGLSVWRHGAYGLLSVITSYFEMVGKILNPHSKKRKSSSDDFNFGFGDVYAHLKPHLEEDDISAFRDLLRNGLYHLGYPKKNLLIHSSDKIPLDIVVQPVRDDREDGLFVGLAYLVNPHRMTHTLVEHFGRFIPQVRSNDALKSKFEEFFDDFHTD